jgi:hypothetical protein
VALEALPGPGYLPSLELRRSRRPFDQSAIESLQYGAPQWVFIGDSMLGTRIDPRYLGEISGTGDRNVAFLFKAASGPSWWYLAFKNHLVASGVKPRATFIFFRDTNLTDTMFRLESLYGNELDATAHDSEPELDRIVAARRRGIWARLYSASNRLYEIDLARFWMEPLVRHWFTRMRYQRFIDQSRFDYSIAEYFALDRLRPTIASDMAAAEDPDFDRDIESSVLPDLMRLSREHQLPICFVRVQRRPVNNQPPHEPPELRVYVAKLKAWIEANGGMFRDDTGDPEMTLDLYEDGDHVLDKHRYTEIFRRRLDPLFR